MVIPVKICTTDEPIFGGKETLRNLPFSSCSKSIPKTGWISCPGAFVAGLDAGHAYNTFPLMGGRLIPEEYWAQSGWRNAFENVAAVQLHHRVLALSTLSATVALWAAHRSLLLPQPCALLLRGLVGMAAVQVSNPEMLALSW